REPNRLVERVDGGNGGERHEELVLEETMVCGEVADDRWLDVVAALETTVGEALPADEDAAIAPSLAHRLAISVDGTLVDDRAEPVLALERIADRDLLGLLDEQLKELVMDRALDVAPAVGGALLPAEPKG